jgi:hypothetical protein
MASEKVLAPPQAPPKTSPVVCPSAPSDEPEWLEVSGLGKVEAERLLDWLEANGIEQRQVVVGANNLFVVRYRPRSLRGPL